MAQDAGQGLVNRRTWPQRVGRAMRKVVRMSGFDVVRHPFDTKGADDIAHLLTLRGINVLLDVGANVGQYARQIRRSGYQGRIVSFEPVSATHIQLTKAAARDSAWIAAPRMALGEDDGKAEVQISTFSDMSSLLPTTRKGQDAFPRAKTLATESVDKRRLDGVFSDFVKDDDRCFVKLDTQGFERRILDGAGLVLPSIHGLQLELSLVPLYEGESLFDELHEHVCSLGFEPYLFVPGFYSRRIGRQLQVDCVYFRNDTAD
jgi:FkbM family methyltransferase